MVSLEYLAQPSPSPRQKNLLFRILMHKLFALGRLRRVVLLVSLLHTGGR